MDFTSDWFSHSVPAIQQSLRLLDRPPRQFLEIGSWEGRSACWVLETFPDATITCVDTFQGSPEHVDLDVANIRDRFLRNTAAHASRVTLKQGTSSVQLFGLEPESFDVAYVDGSHEEDDVLADVVMSFLLLRRGGLLLVDDYANPAFPGIRRAVDKFASSFSGRIRSVFCGYQVHFLKVR